MEQKINVAELIKDCPSGMELDSTMYEDICFDFVDEMNMIHCFIQHENYKTSVIFNQQGTPNSISKSKCVIFPKGKTTWKGFVPHCKFKDGDVIYNQVVHAVAIFNKQTDIDTISHCFLNILGRLLFCHHHCKNLSDWRLANEKEKQKLFDAIKENGYKWNKESKTLEKLIKQNFKVGDKIVKRNSISNSWIVSSVSSEYYGLNLPYDSDKVGVLPVSEQDDWELVPNKFDISTLKPFDKVLVRTNNYTPDWTIDFYDGYNPNIGGYFTPFGVSGGKYFQQCIPYEGNEHLRGTTNDCDEYYKNW